MLVSVVVPAHNEEDNIKQTIKNLFSVVSKQSFDAEIILVDDNSTDKTGTLCDDFDKKYKNIRVIHRRDRSGMGNALREGTMAAKGEIVIWTMADLTDDLETIPLFIEKINSGVDMVFGSRYIKGGSAGDLAPFKAFSSRFFSICASILIGTNVHDITNAFRAFRRSVFFSIMTKSSDFGISPEFALKAHLAGFKLDEVSTVYRDRVKGKTKFSMLKMARRYGTILAEVFRQRVKMAVSV